MQALFSMQCISILRFPRSYLLHWETQNKTTGCGFSLRGSFIVDPDGILKAFELHDSSIGRNAKELLRKLQAASFVRESKGTKVCPASLGAWKRRAHAKSRAHRQDIALIRALTHLKPVSALTI